MPHLILTVTTDLNFDQRMIRICTSLQQAGYQVLLVGRELPGSTGLQQKNYQQYRLKCHFNRGKFFYVEFMIRLFFFLRQQRPDGYCFIDLDTALPVLAAARLQGVPDIYDAHELFPEVVEVVNRPAIKSIWEWVEKQAFKRTAAVYTVTQTIADYFEKRYQRNVSVIQNSTVLIEQPQSDKPKSSRKFILYQGAVNEGRGLEQLIMTLPKFPELELLICGKGDLFDQLQQLTAELKLDERVNFLGFVLPDELKTLTANAWLGVNLLENRGLSYYYSLANKFFDYVHAGIPQLCADFPEYKQLNEQFRVAELVALDTTAIEKSIQQLLQDPVYYQELADNCQRARLVWNWQAEEKKLIHLYNAVVPLRS